MRKLSKLSEKANLGKPDEVLAVINQRETSNGTKNVTINAYAKYLKIIGIEWEKPKFKRVEHLPFIPTEEELNALIAGASKTIATFCQLLKETGIRSIEATYLKHSDIDTERKTANITPAKGSNPRILKISPKLTGMLNSLRKRKDEHFFTPKLKNLRQELNRQRKNIAEKLNNPRITQIHFHTFRHFKGTMEYHKTKDIIHVQKVLGHKDIKSTMIYINLEQATFLDQADEYNHFVAHNEQEFLKAIDSGWELVAETKGDFPRYLRKRK